MDWRRELVSFVLPPKKCLEWRPPGGRRFGTGVRPRTVAAMFDSLKCKELAPILSWLLDIIKFANTFKAYDALGA